MADLTKLVESMISGVLTGGATAATTFLAVFRDLKKRVSSLEEKIGTTDPKSGIYLAISTVEDATRKVRREIDAWEDDPPKWATRLIARSRAASVSDYSDQRVLEERIDRALKDFRDRIQRAEDDLGERIRRIERDVEAQASGISDPRLISREEYLKDSQQRSEEMMKIREQLATANGLLRGVMSALGYLDDKSKTHLPGR